MGIDSVDRMDGYENYSTYSQRTLSPEEKPETSEMPEVVAGSLIQPDIQLQGDMATQGKKDDEEAFGAGAVEATSEQIKKAVEEINRKAKDSEAVFGIHEKTNRVTIKIVDKKTKDVIKEVPAEKTLDLIAKAWEMVGLLVDEKR